MLPVLPLDGGRVLLSLLPRALAVKFVRTERYGMLVFLAVLIVIPMIADQFGLFFNPLSIILTPIMEWVIVLLVSVLGLG